MNRDIDGLQLKLVWEE